MPEHLHKRKHLTSFQLIILGFAGVILIGALILTLPVSSASGVVTPFDQALFTSTSAVCVTGLVVQDTGSYWSAFGQAVILLLIQIGGLGVVTVAATFWTGSYSGTYTDWRFGSSNRCSISIYAVRTKNIAHAA